MRLVCPRCGAQYEIDAEAIPARGRDVECSACEHVWRAYPVGFDPAARPALSRPLDESVIFLSGEKDSVKCALAVQYTDEDYTLVDFYNSNDTSNFDNYVGNVRFSTSNLTNLQRVYNEGSLGKYESYRTWQGTDTNGPYIFILLGSGDTKVRTLQMDFKSEYQTAYSEILKTLKINKIPA